MQPRYQREELENGKYSFEKIAKHFPDLLEFINQQIQETQRTLSEISTEKSHTKTYHNQIVENDS